jgi:hypothetical protein
LVHAVVVARRKRARGSLTGRTVAPGGARLQGPRAVPGS